MVVLACILLFVVSIDIVMCFYHIWHPKAGEEVAKFYKEMIMDAPFFIFLTSFLLMGYGT